MKMIVELIPAGVGVPTFIVGASGAVTATNEAELTVGMICAAIGAFFTAASFFMVWYYKEKNFKLAEKAAEKDITIKEL